VTTASQPTRAKAEASPQKAGTPKQRAKAAKDKNKLAKKAGAGQKPDRQRKAPAT
jgi:hypothetical protein